VTEGQRWRRRRDLSIYIARRNGVPLEVVADVFDLSESRVSEIWTRLHTSEKENRTESPALDSEEFATWLRSEFRKTEARRGNGCKAVLFKGGHESRR
jgi:hypothetical protein